MSILSRAIRGGGVSALDALTFEGVWNAATNTPTLVSSTGTKGDYFLVGTTGSTNLDGETGWTEGDAVVFTGSVWERVGRADLVTSVAGKIGAVLLVGADIGGFTQGSIPFADATGNLAEDNAKFFWDATNDRLGIGTNTPNLPLDIAATTTSMQQTRWANEANSGAGIAIQRSRGATVDADTVVVSGDNIGVINFFGYDGGDFTSAAQIKALVDGVPGVGDMPGRLEFSTTAAGDSSPTERMRIVSNGNVGIGGTPGAFKFDVFGDVQIQGKLTLVEQDIVNVAELDVGQILLQHALNPKIDFIEDDADFNEKLWRVITNSGRFIVETKADDGGVGEQAIRIERLGTLLTVMDLNALELSLQVSGTDRIKINTAGIGVFDVAPVARAGAYTRDADVVTSTTLLANASATVANNNAVIAQILADQYDYGWFQGT